MSLLGWVVRQLFEPPRPDTPVEKVAKKAWEAGKTTLDVAELANEVLPEKGPVHHADPRLLR